MSSRKKNGKGMRLYPPPPKDFDPFAATKKDLIRHGLPLRPDPQTQPGMAALWERQAARYRSFEHIEPRPDTTTASKTASPVPALTENSLVSCGYELFSFGDPFTTLAITWTVPDLAFTPGQFVSTDHFHTFVGLGSLDVHVEMTVDSSQNVTSKITAEAVGDVNLPVRPGDVLSGVLCLNPQPPGTAAYFLANETTAQTVNFSVDGFLPARSINAGVTRDPSPGAPPIDLPLARFGIVYFDLINAYTASGTPSLTSGNAINMIDQHGKTLAEVFRITDSAFRVMFVSA